MNGYLLTHLRQLEAESIHIIREVAAEFENPVMLYSIGKDSSVMLRLAMKAFYPGPLPFPLLHIDTGLEVPRDDRLSRRVLPGARAPPASRTRTARRRRGRQPVHGTQQVNRRHEDPGPAPGAHTGRVRCGVRWGAARRGEVAREGARLLLPRPLPPVGPQEPAARAVEPLQREGQPGKASACSRSRTGPSSTCGSTSTSSRSPSFRSTSPRRARIVERDGNLIMVDDNRAAAPSRTSSPRCRSRTAEPHTRPTTQYQRRRRVL